MNRTMSPGSSAPDARFGACRSSRLSTRADGTLLLEANEPLGPYPERLSDRLAEQAALTPERDFVCVREPSAPGAPPGPWRRVSYAQMLQRARAVATALLKAGASRERPVAILSDNDLEHLTLAMGALWAGVPWVPVSPAYSLISQDFGKLRHILGLVTPSVVFASGPAYARAIEAAAPADARVLMPDAGADALGAATIAGRAVLPFSAWLAEPPSDAADAAQAATGPGTIAKFLFTSGSTREPKGVVNTHRMLCANQQMLRQVFAFFADEPPVLVDWLPWNHTFGGNHNVGLVLYNGGTLYLDDGKPTPAGIGRTIANLREVSPTIYFNVPRGFEELAAAMADDEALRRSLFARVRCFMYAGAGLSQAVWDRLDELAVATRGARVPIVTGLGMTETAPSCTFAVGDAVRSGHIGLPAPGVRVKLVPDAEGSGKTEVRFAGPNVMPGYWRMPEQSAAAFDEEGFYRTGDAVAWIDEANPLAGLRFDGRIAEDFKLSSGTFVSVGPLRAAVIAQGDPWVQDVVVAGIDRDDVGLLVFPRVEDLRRAHGLPADLPVAELLERPEVLARFQDLLDRLWRAGTGSASRPARLLLLAQPPQIDAGELTDKGSLNQRAVLKHRAALVARLWDEAPAAGPGAPTVLRARHG